MSSALDDFFKSAQSKVSSAVDYLETATTSGLLSGSVSVGAQLAKYSLGVDLLVYTMETHGIMLQPITSSYDAYTKLAYWYAIGARILLRKDKKKAAYLASMSQNLLNYAAAAKVQSFTLPGSTAGCATYVTILANSIKSYDPGLYQILVNVVFHSAYKARNLRLATMAAAGLVAGYVVYQRYF